MTSVTEIKVKTEPKKGLRSKLQIKRRHLEYGSRSLLNWRSRVVPFEDSKIEREKIHL